MKHWLIMNLVVIFFALGACSHVPVQPDQPSDYIVEYKDLQALYQQFQTFKDDAEFIAKGFVEDSNYLDWLMKVQHLQKIPGYAPEGSRMLAILAMAYRQEGKDSFIYQQIEQSFTELLDKARITQDESVVILYTGNTSGRLVSMKEGEGFVGGLARRAAMIDMLRQREDNVLVLDVGDALARGDANLPISKVMIEAMNIMGYAAMGLGAEDFEVGEEGLKKLSALADFPIICTNLIFDAGVTPWVKSHAVVNIAGRRIAILSLVPADAVNTIKDAQLAVPREALEKEMALLKDQVDALVLLTQFDALEIATILDPDDPITIVFSAAQGGALDSPKYIFPAANGGSGLGFFRMVQSETGQLHPAAQSIINLLGPEEDKDILNLIKDFK